jgi:hypothetical protein
MANIKDLLIKLQAAAYVLQAGKVVAIEKLTLRRMALEPERYTALAEGLAQLPVPEALRIGKRTLAVPQTLEDFSNNITYGQRLYLARSEPYDLGLILRFVAGYYYPLYAQKPWDENAALTFGRIVLNLHVINLYPVTMQLVNLMAELATRESKLLHREPSKQERAAGIERLNKFSELTSLMFLCESFKCTEAAVMLMPYNDCLVRFMLAKEQATFHERLTEIIRKENTPKKVKK